MSYVTHLSRGTRVIYRAKTQRYTAEFLYTDSQNGP